MAALHYEISSDPEWSEAAARNSEVELRPNEDEPVAIVIESNCPRCSHPTAHIEPVVVFRNMTAPGTGEPLRQQALANALARVGGRSRERDVVVICACAAAHRNRPDRRVGCGASWTLHVEWGI